MEDKDKILSFQSNFDSIESNLAEVESDEKKVRTEIHSTSRDIQEIYKMLGLSAMNFEFNSENSEITSISDLNSCLSDISELHLLCDLDLSVIDVCISIVAGVIATIIDILFVGTPEVVKIYRGEENFDGSKLTSILRKIGNGDDKFSEILEWLCDKCKVPYDISAVKNVVTPNNHRLRNFSHDPLLGIFFAVADIIMGTATLVDNDGKLRIIVNPKDYPVTQKYLALFYYIGHLISDVCTARGLPIPGMFLTQFFTAEIYSDESISSIVEQMYKDGYDLRHLTSMSTSIAVKNLIIEIYIRLQKNTIDYSTQTIISRELQALKNKEYKYRLILISDAICCNGNIIKFFIPPTAGSVTALNLPEWCSIIKNTILELRYQLRDKSVEKIISNRNTIESNWISLLANIT